MNQLTVKLACLMQHRQKYQAKILICLEVRVFVVHDNIYDYSSDVMYCDVCRKAGPDIAGNTEFVTGKKKCKRESLVYRNKSQKHEKCFNMVSAKAHSLTYTSTFLAPVNHLQVQSSEKQSEKK